MKGIATLTELAKAMAGSVNANVHHPPQTQHRTAITMERVRKWSPIGRITVVLVTAAGWATTANCRRRGVEVHIFYFMLLCTVRIYTNTMGGVRY